MTGPDDARAGGGDLRGKLAHATTARAVAADRARALELQLARQAEKYQSTIKKQADRIRDLENENATLSLELDFFQRGEPGAPRRAERECAVDLCENPAEANEHCAEHAWIVDGG